MENYLIWLIPTGIIALAMGFKYWRYQRQTVGLAIGVYDFCHEGHVNLLRRAAQQCDRLVVAVHTDRSVRDYKGLQPANSERERAATIEALGFAHKVIIDSDREKICRKNRVKKIFHGDDWTIGKYRQHWGEELIDNLGIEVVLLPHTPGINSTTMRAETPKIGWWLYSSVPGWSRSHIFSHLKGLYDALGGIWFLARTGREAVREVFPDAPCVFLESGQDSATAVKSIEHHDLDVMVTAHFNYESMVGVLSKLEKPISLVVLSHGRSGKKGTSADVANERASEPSSNFTEGPQVDGGRFEKIDNLTIYDWSFATNSYTHLDSFLKSGGSFQNEVPAGKPKILILPTWSNNVDDQGLILAERWLTVFKDISKDHDLLLSPHPLAEKKVLDRFAKTTGATILPAEGHSHVHVPKAHLTICDLSGAFWEALLFDTPAVLASSTKPKTWDDSLAPTKSRLKNTVPECTPDDLAKTVRELVGKRSPQQNSLAEERLGRVDGHATQQLMDNITSLLSTTSKSSPTA
ncbi:MAG: adenylyltransferase/cytidyltransferase family protein [bacterium]|nr:adenylyltransferase/cytidyltransferase family protein [bacterium]